MYNPTDSMIITTINATIMHFFGEYFAMPHLRWKAKEFRNKDIHLEKNAHIYYWHTITLQDEDTLNAVFRVCRGKHDDILLQFPKLFEIPDPCLLLHLLTVPPKMYKHSTKPKIFSRYVAEYCTLHEVDKSLIDTLR